MTDVQNDRGDYFMGEVQKLHGERIVEESTMGTLNRVEHELLYSSEKLYNLQILLMEVARRSIDTEPLDVDHEIALDGSVEKQFEFDILSGFVDSEVKELDGLVISRQTDLNNVKQKVSRDESSKKELDKLQSVANYLQQVQNLVADISGACTNFKFGPGLGNDWTGTGGPAIDNGHPSFDSSRWKMQTAEQRRSVLQALENSMANEMDLDKKLSDSISINKDLQRNLHHVEQEVSFLEESLEMISDRMFEAEISSDLYMRVVHELVCKIGTVELKLQQEKDARSKLEESLIKLHKTEDSLQLQEARNMALQQRVEELEGRLKQSDIQLQLAKDSLSKAENRVEAAEIKCLELSETNQKYSEEIDLLKNRESEKVNILASKLKESDTQLAHARGAVEAIEEEQGILKSTLSGMENVITDLKSKVSKAENRAESMESKCNLLTETNLELSAELDDMRSRVKDLEKSLQRANHAKLSYAKDVGVRTKLITDLVAKFPSERERLHLKIENLTKKNKVLSQRCKALVDERVINSRISIPGRDEFSENNSPPAISIKASKNLPAAAVSPYHTDEPQPQRETSPPPSGSTIGEEAGLAVTPEAVRTIAPRHLGRGDFIIIGTILLGLLAVVYYAHQVQPAARK